MASVVRIPRPQATRPNEVWSMDFIFDRTSCGRQLKILCVVDDFTKKCVTALIARSIRGEDLVRHFSALVALPKRLRSDNGPEFQSQAMLVWSSNFGVEQEFIQPGKPTQNAYIESFNGRIRDECLNQHEFFDVEDAMNKIDSWIEEYNSIRPHSSLGMMSPNEFASAVNS